MQESPPCSLRSLVLLCLPFLFLHVCKWRLSSALDLYVCVPNTNYRIECNPGERLMIEEVLLGRRVNDSVNCINNAAFEIEEECGIIATVDTSGHCSSHVCNIEFSQENWNGLLELQNTSKIGNVCPSNVPVYIYFRYECYLNNSIGTENNVNDSVAAGSTRTLLRTSTLFALLPGLCISALLAGVLG